MTVYEQRTLGIAEKMMASATLAEVYGPICMAAVMRHKISCPGTATVKRHIFSAVASTIRKHPLLRAIVLDADQPNARFSTLARINLDDLISVHDCGDEAMKTAVDSVLAFEVNRSIHMYTRSKPLWRLRVDVYASHTVIVWTIHHVIGDGRSLHTFMTGLLGQLQYAAAAPPSSSHVVEATGQQRIMPALENRHPNPPPSSLRSTVDINSQLWCGDQHSSRSSHAPDTEIRTVSLSGEPWKRLVHGCKAKHGISPHAAIMTACALVFSDLYPGQQVKIFTAVDTRRTATDPPAPIDEAGNFFGFINRVWDGGQGTSTQFWPLAVAYHEFVHANIRHDCSAHLHSFRSTDYPRGFCDLWASHDGGLYVSDLGLLQLPPSPPPPSLQQDPVWQLENIFFGQSSFRLGFTLVISTISTQDSMNASVCWRRGALHPNKAHQYPEAVIKCLLSSINDL